MSENCGIKSKVWGEKVTELYNARAFIDLTDILSSNLLLKLIRRGICHFNERSFIGQRQDV